MNSKNVCRHISFDPLIQSILSILYLVAMPVVWKTVVATFFCAYTSKPNKILAVSVGLGLK